METDEHAQQPRDQRPRGGRAGGGGGGNGPKRPDETAYREKTRELRTKRSKLIEEIKALQSTVKVDEGRNQLIEEKKEIQKKMDSLNALKTEQTELRKKKNEEKAALYKKKREANDRQRALQSELCGFESPAEMDKAIALLRRHLEASTGKPGVDRKLLKQISQLEEGKSIFVRLNAAKEAVASLAKEESALQEQCAAIQESVNNLSKQYYEARTELHEKDAEIKKRGESRQTVYSQCDQIRKQVNEVDAEIKSLKEALDAEFEQYREAQKKYNERIQRERAEREQRYHEMANAAKREEKLARARSRLNPCEKEALACTLLIQFLTDKKRVVAKEAEERARREAAANYDPAAAAPEGWVVINEGNFKKNTKGRGGAKTKKGGAGDNVAAAASGARPSPNNFKEPELLRFQQAGVEPPAVITVEEIEKKIEELKTKKAEYDSRNGNGELVLSSDHDDEEEEAENANDEVAAGVAEAMELEPAAEQKQQPQPEGDTVEKNAGAVAETADNVEKTTEEAKEAEL